MRVRGTKRRMFEIQTQLEKPESVLQPAASRGAWGQTRQHRLMIAALGLLILALAIVIYRGLFTGGDEEADYDQPEQPAAIAPTSPAQTVAPVAAPAKPAVSAKHHSVARKTPPTTPATNPAPADAPPMAAELQRTVLPPMEVEVVAGDNHKTVRPGSNSVRLDLQPGVPPQSSSEPTRSSDTAAAATQNAAEKVEMSAGEQLVTRTVQPEYPLLARQAKVQGSVILQALIGKDGIIQNLRVVGGPPILASAAQDAVRQWRFKPHLIGVEPVETQAKITVNFTISTN